MISAKKETVVERLLTTPSWILFSVLLLFILFSYSNTLYSPFVLDDNHSFIAEQKVFVDDFSLSNITQLASTGFGIARFLPMLSFAIDHKLSNGASIVPYHITNISIHLLATLSLFFFLQGLLQTEVGKKSLTFINTNHFVLFICGLWALNPVQTNAVTYIVQRMASMAALFYLAALAFYIYGRISSNTLKRFFCFFGFTAASVCAFLSKENSITLPIAVLLVECLFITPGRCSRMIKKIQWYQWAGFILLFVLLLPLMEHRWQVNIAGYANRHFSMLERVLTESRVLVFYLSLLFFPLPSRMSLEHDFPLSYSLFDPPSTILSILLLGLLTWAAFKYRKKYPLISFGIFWFFLTLFIESTIVNLELVFEHRLYLPAVGFYLVVMAIVDSLCAWFKKKYPLVHLEQILFLCMTILISLSSVLTTLRNNDWRDSASIYQDCVNKAPHKARSYVNLGIEFGRQGRYDEGLVLLEMAMEVGQTQYEEYLKAANNSLVILVDRGESDEAIRKGEEYLRNAPRNIGTGGLVQFMYNLGIAYYDTGQYQAAMKKYVNSFMYNDERGLKENTRNMMMKTLLAAYDDPISREALHLPERGDDKQGAMQIRMAQLMLDLRDYRLANNYIQKNKDLYPEDEKILEFEKRYLEETEKNSLQIRAADYHNHQAYQSDFLYRFSLSAAEFVLKHYSPLSGGAEWLLRKMQARMPVRDSFISLYLIKLYTKSGKDDLIVKELENTLLEFPDFVPLLEITGSYYRQINSREKAQEIYEHILELYPGHPKWFFYNKIILESNGTET
jgi:tetratricopeptide (TPR) repeat protein